MKHFFRALLLIMIAEVAVTAQAQTDAAPDITRQPMLYVVPYAHLDTQWRWEFPQTISEFMLNGLDRTVIG
jgi:alpha-mannosidase